MYECLKWGTHEILLWTFQFGVQFSKASQNLTALRYSWLGTGQISTHHTKYDQGTLLKHLWWYYGIEKTSFKGKLFFMDFLNYFVSTKWKCPNRIHASLLKIFSENLGSFHTDSWVNNILKIVSSWSSVRVIIQRLYQIERRTVP